MWTKITKTVATSAIIAVALIATLATPASTFAHGPENHKGLCTSKNLSMWHDNAGPCDPGNPPNISSGITNQEGDTTKNYPNGLCYPSFNNYTDMIDNRFLEDFGITIGMDPYGSNPPLFKDERNFLKVRKVDETPEYADFKDAVSVQDGDELTFLIYMHNDGDPCFNDNIDVPSGKFFSNWNTTSHNTKVKIAGDFVQDDTNIFSKFSSAKQFNASIWSDDAVNAQGLVAPITNGVTITPIGGKELELVYKDETVFYTDYDSGWNYTEHAMQNGKDLFKSTGMQLSTLFNGNVKGSGGDYYASEPYIGVIILKFDVEEVKPPVPEVCSLFRIEREGSKMYNGEEKAYKIEVKDLAFGTDPIPEGTKIKWTTTDPDGKFWLGNEATDAGTWADPNWPSDIPASVLWSPKTISTNPDDYVYYIGTGTVSAVVDAVDDSLESTLCKDSVAIPIEKEVCDTIQIDYPQTITEGTLSWFRADALNTDQETFASTITYSVTPGYGYFFTTKPDGHVENDSPMIYEPEVVVIPFWDILNGVTIFTGATLAEETGSTDSEGNYSLNPETIGPLVTGVATGSFWNYSPGYMNPNDIVNPDEWVEVDDNPLDIPPGGGPDPSPIANPGTMDSQTGHPANTSLMEGNYTESAGSQAGIHSNFGTANPATFGQISVFDIPTAGSIGTATAPTGLAEANYSVASENTALFDNAILGPKAGILTLEKDLLDYALSSVTVEQGDIVWFYAKKPGTNVITVKTTSSDEADCQRKFSIAAAPEKLECGSMKLTAVTTSKQFPTCMSEENGKVALNAQFFSTNDQLINTADVKVKWTAAEGVFDMDPGDIPTIVQNQFINGVSTYYTGSGSVTAELFTLKGEVYEGTECVATIPACDAPPVCAQLDITSDPLLPFVGDVVHLSASGTDTFGSPLPETTLIDWSSTAGGKLFDLYGNITFTPPSLTATINKPIQLLDSTQEGEIKAAISQTDPLYSTICKDSVPVAKIIEGLVCTDLIATVTSTTSNLPVDALKPGGEYSLKATATYSAANPNGTITYSIDPSVGFFYKKVQTEEVTVEASEPTIGTGDSETPPFMKYFIDKTAGIDTIGTGTDEIPPYMKFIVDNAVEFIAKNDKQIFESTIEAAQGEEVFLQIYGNLDTSVQNALVITATGYPNCIATYDLLVTPVGQEWACVDLDIVKPDSNWDIDEDDDEQSVKIEVDTSPGNHADELWYHWEIDDVDDAKWEDSNDDTLIEKGDLTNKFTWDKDTGEPLISVWASYEKNGSEINACEDMIRADDDEGKPKIIKQAYTKDIDDADNKINIGSKTSTKELTYIYTFTAGNVDIDWSDIIDEEFNSGNIFGDKVDNGKKGYLSYKGMRINVKPDDFTKQYYKNKYNEHKDDEDDQDYEDYDGYTLLETGDYDEENDDEDYFNKDNFGNSDDYEDRYSSCDNDQGGVCIDLDKYNYDDFEEVAESFTEGDEIRFKNIEKDMIIMIKVQVENHTVITAEYCDELTTIEGCGEEFENKVSFETSDDNTGSAEATITSVCPYILTRSGGDVFFHDVIDTGIDVSYCSPVKSSTGTGITKTPIKIPGITSTGSNTVEDGNLNIELSMPTHDVCQFSNSQYSNNSIEEYQNPLANFSSTICELRADVSKNWEETYIKKSITANIDRIARWGENLQALNVDSSDNGYKIITNEDDLKDVPNAGNGIYVREGNLTIDLSSPTSLADGTANNLPAAKTFIVIGGNLKIKNNISAEYNFAGTDIKPKDVPSYAFIVIGGNIIIDNDVTQIDGIIMAVDLDLTSNNDGGTTNSGGDINPSEPATNNILTINGSLFGNVSELFKARQGVGEVLKDEGSVTIRYDERVLLNTPPGISELVDVATTLVP